MADRIREVQCYLILDDTQETLEMPQAAMKVDVLDKDGNITSTKQMTVAEAYPTARRSLDGKKLVIPVEVEAGEEFETVYNALKAKFGKKVMAHKETIKALDTDEWREPIENEPVEHEPIEVVK